MGVNVAMYQLGIALRWSGEAFRENRLSTARTRAGTMDSASQFRAVLVES